MSQEPPPPPPPPESSGEASGLGQPADVTVRFIARAIDGIVLAVATSIVSIVVSPLLPGPTGAFTVFAPGRFFLRTLVLAVVGAAIYLAYFALLEASRGQTVGKMLVKLQVRGPDGENPSMEAALKRNAWVALSIVPGVGYLLQLAAAGYIGYTIHESPTQTGWHDQFADGTQVVKLG